MKVSPEDTNVHSLLCSSINIKNMKTQWISSMDQRKYFFIIFESPPIMSFIINFLLNYKIFTTDISITNLNIIHSIVTRLHKNNVFETISKVENIQRHQFYDLESKALENSWNIQMKTMSITTWLFGICPSISYGFQ